MWQKLPSWIWIGAWALAFVAGMVNVVRLLGFEHQALTQMTGLTSRLAVGLAQGDGANLVVVLAVILSFVGGATLSGIMIPDSALSFGRRYGTALLLEAVLLTVATALLKHHFSAGFYMAAFACGLQNALATNFSGATLRTTHVSGMFTDLGISIGHWFRRRPVDHMRVRICISTITGFAAGGATSAIVFRQHGVNTLFIPAAIALALSIAYSMLRQRAKRGQLFAEAPPAEWSIARAA